MNENYRPTSWSIVGTGGQLARPGSSQSLAGIQLGKGRRCSQSSIAIGNIAQLSTADRHKPIVRVKATQMRWDPRSGPTTLCAIAPLTKYITSVYSTSLILYLLTTVRLHACIAGQNRAPLCPRTSPRLCFHGGAVVRVGGIMMILDDMTHALRQLLRMR